MKYISLSRITNGESHLELQCNNKWKLSLKWVVVVLWLQVTDQEFHSFYYDPFYEGPVCGYSQPGKRPDPYIPPFQIASSWPISNACKTTP